MFRALCKVRAWKHKKYPNYCTHTAAFSTCPDDVLSQGRPWILVKVPAKRLMTDSLAPPRGLTRQHNAERRVRAVMKPGHSCPASLPSLGASSLTGEESEAKKGYLARGPRDKLVEALKGGYWKCTWRDFFFSWESYNFIIDWWDRVNVWQQLVCRSVVWKWGEHSIFDISVTKLCLVLVYNTLWSVKFSAWRLIFACAIGFHGVVLSWGFVGIAGEYFIQQICES